MRVRATNISGQESARLSVPQAGKLTRNALPFALLARDRQSAQCRRYARVTVSGAAHHPVRECGLRRRLHGSQRSPILFHSAPLPKQGNCPPLTIAAKQQRVAQGRTFHDLARPLVAPREA